MFLCLSGTFLCPDALRRSAVFLFDPLVLAVLASTLRECKSNARWLALVFLCCACQTTPAIRAGRPSLTLPALKQPPLRLPDDFAARHPSEIFKGTYRICIAPVGTVSEITSLKAIPEVNQYLMEQIKASWVYEKRDTATCFAKHVLIEASDQLHPANESQELVQPIRNPAPPLMIAYFEKHPNDITRGTYELCITENGKVSAVQTIKGVDGMNEGVISFIKANWLYEPVPSPVCIKKRLVFETYSYSGL
jgi:hypothetical protein